MGSLMTDLEENLASLNKWKEKNGQKPLTTDELLVKLFDEVAYVWPKVGFLLWLLRSPNTSKTFLL